MTSPLSSRPSPQRDNRSERCRPRRGLSVENDYPELSGDFALRGAPGYNGSGPGTSSSRPASSDLGMNSAIQGNQLVSRRLKLDMRNDCETLIAGVRHWNRPNNAATGQSITLYERHPFTAENAGNPIADTFAVVAMKNAAIMVLGDGVNWGNRAALASRCAVSGCVEYLTTAIFANLQEGNSMTTQVRCIILIGAYLIDVTVTLQEVFQCLLRSFHAAHSLILQEEAQLTTLTACVILPVIENGNSTRSFDISFI